MIPDQTAPLKGMVALNDTDKRPVSPVNGQPLPRGRPFEPGDRAREIGRKGGKRSKEKQRERKTLCEDLLAVLTDLQVPQKDSGKQVPVQEALAISLIKSALNGNVRAFEIIRDTIGEKPSERVEIATPDLSALDEAFRAAGDAK